MSQAKARRNLILCMVIFGTVGIFRRYIPLNSSLIAFVRGLVGALFLLGVMALRRKGFDRAAVGKNLWKLLVSGALIGINWILLFEAYRFTSVAVATVCYYMAPVFVMLASPLVLGEKLSVKKGLCVLAALCGVVLVSGVLRTGFALTELQGALFALGAAVLYASVVLINKTILGVPAYDKTVVQLLSAALVLVPYLLLTGSFSFAGANGAQLGLLLAMAIVVTGVPYALYFGCMEYLPTSSVALLSYLDPVVAILLGVLLLHEGMGLSEVLGSVLVLGATAVCELPERTKTE